MSKFQDYVTSAAFRIDLSAKMCKALAYVYVSHDGMRAWWNGYAFTIEKRPDFWPDSEMRLDPAGTHTLHALERRGLIEWLPRIKEEGKPSFGLQCTDEGRLVLQLVVRAGVLSPEIVRAVKKKAGWVLENKQEAA